MPTRLRGLIPASAALLLCAAIALPAFGEVAPANVISDNMVLQRDMAAPIWGTAEPGEKVTVKIAGQSKTAAAGQDGKWALKLEPMKAGGPFDLTVAGKKTVTIKNVMVGEVWLCSGQSNMVWRVSGVLNAEQETAEANYPGIRMYTGVQGPWQVCSPSTARSFSAAAYFFGRELHKALGVPIGLINESVGGTSARLWTPPDAVKAVPELKPVIDASKAAEASHPQRLKRYEEALKKWQETKQGRQPRRPRLRKVGDLYESMVKPVIPYAIRGAIWYQGEADAGRHAEYRILFPTMIQAWRKAWGQGGFPFLFVQLPNYRTSWMMIREAQQHALSLPNTGMAVTIDVGDLNNIHPKNKQPVGRRLALIARSKVYGQDVVCSGPAYDSFEVKAGEVHVKFTEVHGGLVSRGGEPGAFLIAGADRKFVPAQARIDGQTVVVSSPEVAKPVAVRYAWAPNPPVNLYNKAGLPAAPFRTDDW
ncbi:MAG TPA: sialate O-acetylesterase [Phycisphaerae bacterium]|nr:sialate O-acetylesterase [Phycisphaerae bacterium]